MSGGFRSGHEPSRRDQQEAKRFVERVRELLETPEVIEWRGRSWTVVDARFDRNELADDGSGHWHVTLTQKVAGDG